MDLKPPTDEPMFSGGVEETVKIDDDDDEALCDIG